MTITSPEIRLQPPQIHGDHSHRMRRVHKAQHAFLPAHVDQLLNGESDPGHADDGLEYGHLCPPGLPTIGGRIHPSNSLPELVDQFGVGDWKVVFYFNPAHGCGLFQRGNGLLDGAVDRVEVQDHIARLEGKIAQDGVHARRGVLDKHAVMD